jgi:hypothetical protein
MDQIKYLIANVFLTCLWVTELFYMLLCVDIRTGPNPCIAPAYGVIIEETNAIVAASKQL